MKKLVCLILGVSLIAVPFVFQMENEIAAVLCIIFSAPFFSVLRDKSKYQYLVTKQTHIFGKKR